MQSTVFFDVCFILFWGLRSKAAALRFGARRSARPFVFSLRSKTRSGPAGHPAASLGQSLRSSTAASVTPFTQPKGLFISSHFATLWRQSRRPKPSSFLDKKKPVHCCTGFIDEVGSDLLSHFRSTIGAEGLNCSVRNGKRCLPLAMTTINSLFTPLDELFFLIKKACTLLYRLYRLGWR